MNDADCPEPVCGDSMITGDETCDIGFVYPAPGSCSPDCDDNRSCTIDLIRGAADTCDVSCETSRTSACVNDDGCCPPQCTGANDNDCANVVCGDSNVDGDEGCDNAIAAGFPGACPIDAAECDDGDPCTTDTVEGVSADCSARCVNTPLPCAGGDSCCPYTCSATEDAECAELSLCDVYCERAMMYCTGANELYASSAACQLACETMATGRPGGDATNTVHCRNHHLLDAAADPDQHCMHAAEVPVEGCVDFE